MEASCSQLYEHTRDLAAVFGRMMQLDGLRSLGELVACMVEEQAFRNEVLGHVSTSQAERAVQAEAQRSAEAAQESGGRTRTACRRRRRRTPW